jgi:ATP-dependent RNA helicase DDX31/DBP7
VAATPPAKPQQKAVGNARQRPAAPTRPTSEDEDEEETVEMEEASESSEEDSDASEGEGEGSGVKPARKKAAAAPPANPKPASDKPTRKTLTQVPAPAEKLAEFHARPSLLSEAAAAQPAATTTSRHLFTAAKIESLELHPHLVSLLKSPREHMGFGLKHCTKVQSAAIPRLMTGQNALLSSETGSGAQTLPEPWPAPPLTPYQAWCVCAGKTLAYLLPLLQQLQAVEPRPQRSDGTLALVLAPTRELCHQVRLISHPPRCSHDTASSLSTSDTPGLFIRALVVQC